MADLTEAEPLSIRRAAPPSQPRPHRFVDYLRARGGFAAYRDKLSISPERSLVAFDAALRSAVTEGSEGEFSTTYTVDDADDIVKYNGTVLAVAPSRAPALHFEDTRRLNQPMHYPLKPNLTSTLRIFTTDLRGAPRCRRLFNYRKK